MANCPMCGYVWNEATCSTCGWVEGKQPRYSTPRRRLTRKQKEAYQQRGASMRAMDAQSSAVNEAVDAGELVIGPPSPSVGEAPSVDGESRSPSGEQKNPTGVGG